MLPPTFYWETHHTTISTSKLFHFLSDVDVTIYRKKTFFSQFGNKIKDIANEESVWETQSEAMLVFKKYVKENWLTIPSNTQPVKCWVTDANELTHFHKDESLADDLALLRYTTIFHYLRIALIQHKGKTL